MWSKGVLLVATSVVMGILTVPGPASGAEPVQLISSLNLVGPSDQAREWSSLAGDSISVDRPYPDRLTFHAMGPDGERRAVSIAAPAGEVLGVGTYEDASSTASRRSEDPEISITLGSTSLEGYGRFTIHDLADSPGTGSVWFTFEFHSRLGTAWFGEARALVRITQPQLLLTPTRVAWPDEYPGHAAAAVPVTVRAQGDAPVVIEDVAVTAGASEFAVQGTNCTVLAPGDSCRIEVGFTPTSPGLRTGTVTVSDSTPAGVHAVTVSGHGIPGVTSWTLDSPPNDGVGGDGKGVVDPDAYDLAGSGTPTGMSFAFETRAGVEAPTDFVSGNAEFRTDADHPFVAGQTFTGATGWRTSSDMPQMDVVLDSLGCNALTGQFTIVEATYRRGLMRSAEVDFEQRCSEAHGTLTGTIRWRADQSPTDPPPPGDVTPPKPVTGLRVVTTDRDPFVLAWDDSTSPDWSDVIVRGAPGSTAPSTPEDGYHVYRGRLPQAVVNDLAMAGEHSFSVFTRDLVGNLSSPTTITVPDIVPPPPVTGLRVDADGDTVALQWDEPVAPDWDHAFVRVERWPDESTDAQVIEAGRATSAMVEGVDGTSNLRFGVFVVDNDGNVNKGTWASAHRTQATLTSAASRLTCGDVTTLQGDLSDAFETYATFFRPIVLQRRSAADQPWVDAQEYSGVYGEFRFWVSPCTNTQYRVRYPGERHHLGTTSDIVAVLVAPHIELAASRTGGPLGTRFPLVATVQPAQPDLSMKLQRLRSTGWRTVATKSLSDAGTVRFVVRPSSRGRFVFRVVSVRSEALLRGVSNRARIRVY